MRGRARTFDRHRFAAQVLWALIPSLLAWGWPCAARGTPCADPGAAVRCVERASDGATVPCAESRTGAPSLAGDGASDPADVAVDVDGCSHACRRECGRSCCNGTPWVSSPPMTLAWRVAPYGASLQALPVRLLVASIFHPPRS